MEAVERFAVQREEDAKVERERLARQRVKWEQDEAYQMSLDADRSVERGGISAFVSFVLRQH